MKKRKINCQEATELVNRYISRTLTLEELQLFLAHIKKCPSCKEELETYFIVETALKQLDRDDDNTMLDIKEFLETDLARRKRQVTRGIVIKNIKRIMSVLVIGALVLFLLLLGFLLFNVML